MTTPTMERLNHKTKLKLEKLKGHIITSKPHHLIDTKMVQKLTPKICQTKK